MSSPSAVAAPVLAADATRRAPDDVVVAATAAPVHLRALTGVRFVASVHIVLIHTIWDHLAHLPAPFAVFVRAANANVGLFFVLSGFVLAYNYDQRDLTNRAVFWSSRLARVYPVYLLGLLVALPLYLRTLAFQHGAVPAGHFAAIAAADLSLLQAWVPSRACEWNCPGWSLSVEAFLYLAFPLLVLVGVRLSRRALLAAAAGAYAVSLALLAVWLLSSDAARADLRLTMYYFPLVRLPEFVVGVATGIWFGRAPPLRWAGPLSVLAMLTVIAVGATALPAPLAEARHLAMVPVFALLVVTLAAGRGPLAQLLSTTPLVRLGEASYALYLLHLPLWSYARMLHDPEARRAAGGGIGGLVAFHAVYWIVIVGVSLAVYRWYEEPARRGIRRWFMTRQRRHAPVPAAS